MTKSFIDNLKKLLRNKRNITIFPHKNPDGDAIGSCLALNHFLKKLGHNSNVISPNDYPDFLNWMPGIKNVLRYSSNKIFCEKLINESDIVFTLDFNSLKRVEILGDLIKKSKSTIVMIDHHENPEDFSDLTYSDSKIASTCEMTYNVLEKIKVDEIDWKIASCLYTGIITDTGSFKFPSTSSRTHLIVSKLLEKGINHTEIHQNIYDNFKKSRISLLSVTLSNLKILNPINTVYMTLTQKELKDNNFKKGDTEGFVNYGLSIKGVLLSIILIENSKEKIIKMSFRSKGDFDVNILARDYFNGGGHSNASGGVSYKNMDETIKYLISILNKFSNKLK